MSIYLGFGTRNYLVLVSILVNYVFWAFFQFEKKLVPLVYTMCNTEYPGMAQAQNEGFKSGYRPTHFSEEAFLIDLAGVS